MIDQKWTHTFKEGDEVIMHSCFEANLPKNKNKVWICQTDSFITRSKDDVVFLRDYSGYFLSKFLRKKVNSLS